MSLTMRGNYSRIIELQQQLELVLGACVDYHDTLVRAHVPDPVTGRPEIQKMYSRFGVALTPRSLYGGKI